MAPCDEAAGLLIAAPDLHGRATYVRLLCDESSEDEGALAEMLLCANLSQVSTKSRPGMHNWVNLVRVQRTGSLQLPKQPVEEFSMSH